MKDSTFPAVKVTGNALAGSTLLRSIGSRGSGCAVYLLQQPDGRILATKIAQEPRVGAFAQVENRRVIHENFGDRIPTVTFACEGEHDVLVTECPAMFTLQESVNYYGPTSEHYVVWREFVERLLVLWRSTAVPHFEPHLASRNHVRRCERGSRGLRDALHLMFGTTPPLDRVTINGIVYGSWDCKERALLSMGRPAFRVTCHGDPHAGNVLVDSLGDWYLIDWEWTGRHHDWRMMISHLLGSWYVNDVLTNGSGTVSIKQAGLSLSYKISTDQLEWFKRPAVEAFQSLTTKDRYWQDIADLARHTALLLIREIPSVVSSGHYAQAAPLLGEAIRLLVEDPHLQPHPVIQAIIAANDRTVLT